MSKLIEVPLDRIDANPYRRIDRYPYIETKLYALERSIRDVGLWEGAIVREVEGRYQLAFGHHRIEAARRAGLEAATVVERKLTDEQMVQFMGRENGEDYRTEFLIMLETWEAAVKFLTTSTEVVPRIPIAIGRLLGWTVLHVEGHEKLSTVANACSAAQKLMEGGYLSRDDLAGLSVGAAREIVERTQSRIEQLDKMGRSRITTHTAEELEDTKREVAGAAKETAAGAREGRKGHGIRELRGRVDSESYRRMKEAKKPPPLAAAFMRSLIDQIARSFHNDSISEKIGLVVPNVSMIGESEDRQLLSRLDYELALVPERTEALRKQLAGDAKVLPLKQLRKGA